MLKMRYIENFELREWVKENLRKAIFQKAHALAVQTGCEILIKLQDDASDLAQGFYYATDHLGKTYDNAGVRKQPGDLAISGDTGQPVIPMVDQAIQSQDSSTETGTTSTTPLTETTDESETSTQESVGQRTRESSTAVPVELSVDRVAQSQTENLFNIKQEAEEVDKDISVKLEVIEEDADPGLLQTSTEQIDDMQVENSNMDLIQDYQSSYPPMVPMSPKPYQCGMCHKAFRSIQVLQKHTQTFHMRPQTVMMARKKGPYGGGGSKLKQQHQVPFATPEQQRFQCVVCNRSFRHLVLLEDHMTRSHMIHPSSLSSTQQTSFPSPTGDTKVAQSSSIQQQLNTHNIPESGQDTDDLTSTDPPLPKITSVASLQHLVPNTSAVPSAATSSSAPSSSSSSRAPFTQGSPMAPMYRHPGPSNSATSTPASGSSSSSNRVKKDSKLHQSTIMASEFPEPTDQQNVTNERLMGAILLTPGPVCSFQSFNESGPRSLRPTTKQAYAVATSTLEMKNLGTRAAVKAGYVTKLVFVKQVPSLAEAILLCSPDLHAWCSPYEYTLQYQCKLSVKINNNIRKQLVEKGYVKAEQIRY